MVRRSHGEYSTAANLRTACFWCEFGLRIATVDEIENERDTTMAPLPSPPELRQNNQLVSEVLAAATHSTTLRPPSDLQSRLSDGGLSVLSSNIPSAQQTPDTIDSSRPLLASHNTAPAASVAHRLSPPPPTRNSPPPNEGGPLRVLCVDDDPMTRTLMSRMLTRLGCQVGTWRSSRRERRPDAEGQRPQRMDSNSLTRSLVRAEQDLATSMPLHSTIRCRCADIAFFHVTSNSLDTSRRCFPVNRRYACSATQGGQTSSLVARATRFERIRQITSKLGHLAYCTSSCPSALLRFADSCAQDQAGYAKVRNW